MWLKFRIKDFYRTIKRKIRSIPYGFDIGDTWSMDYALAKWMHPRMELFLKNTISHPCDIEYEEWIDYLTEIANKLEYYLYTMDNFETLEKEADARKEYEEALQMFVDRLHDMWD